jgi:hypothetical protein
MVISPEVRTNSELFSLFDIPNENETALNMSLVKMWSLTRGDMLSPPYDS